MSTRTLGSLIRQVRARNAWTLRQMSAKVGIPVSTLAKVEQNKLTLTYDKLQRLCGRLGMTMTELLDQPEPAGTGIAVLGRRSVSDLNNSLSIVTPNRDYEYLCADLRMKRMVPIIERIRTGGGSEPDALSRHAGEGFLFVLEGAIEVYLQFYSPAIVAQGHGIYFDSTQAHGYAAKGCDSAVVLAVYSGDKADLVDDLRELA
jgi:transcriptional regulator with XRE-family HTH domain